MICNTIGLTEDSFESIYTTGGTEVEEVYGAIDYAQPIYAKIREITGTSPLTFTSRVAGTLLDYRISGETIQDGTPSPDMPVDVVGCGVKVDITGLSEPLCSIDGYTDILNLSTGTLTRRIKKLVLTGKENVSYNARNDTVGRWVVTIPTANGTTTPENVICTHFRTVDSVNKPLAEGGICMRSTGIDIVVGGLYTDIGIAAPSDSTTITNAVKSYLAAQYAAGTPVTIWYVLQEPDVSTVPVPSGITGTIEGYLTQDGTPTPEAPIYPTANGVKQTDGMYSIVYGYKLPLTVNGTEYPIYLGQVPATRRIKKLVLTGKETGILSGGSKTFLMPLLPAARRTRLAITVLSNKYNGIPNSWDWGIYGASDNSICFVANSPDPGPTSSYSLAINDSRFGANVSDFKSYLAAQYAAGTPVTIWYVLYEPETGIVNEPLHKIGDYADTISFAQAGVTIPTVSGANVIDMTSTVKPSEVYIKGKIKPDGYGNLTDKNGVYILDKNGVQLTVHGQGTSNA